MGRGWVLVVVNCVVGLGIKYLWKRFIVRLDFFFGIWGRIFRIREKVKNIVFKEVKV